MKKSLITVYLPDNENFKADSREVIGVLGELIEAYREDREPQHRLIDKGILKATGTDSSGSLVELLQAYHKGSDKD